MVEFFYLPMLDTFRESGIKCVASVQLFSTPIESEPHRLRPIVRLVMCDLESLEFKGLFLIEKRKNLLNVRMSADHKMSFVEV